MSSTFAMAELEEHVVTASGCPLALVRMLFEVMTDMTATERQNFVQFVTGSRYLPVGGLAALRPKLTIALSAEDLTAVDARLPSVMTCVNYLKLPNYQSKQLLRKKLFMAIHEGRMSFDLT
jgi:E3 ubiquitin-protein ligase TRIP12